MDGVEFRVTFLYDQDITSSKQIGCNPRGCTYCYIDCKAVDQPDLPVTHIAASATSSSKDQFNKATGRKIAFGRALENICNQGINPGTAYSFKKMMWEEYLSRNKSTMPARNINKKMLYKFGEWIKNNDTEGDIHSIVEQFIKESIS